MSHWNRTISTTIFLIVLSGAQASSQSLPRPTGRFEVGRTALAWMDRNRPEIMTDAPDDFRELQAYIWYPAADVTGSPGAYWPGVQRIAGGAIAGQLSNMFGPIWPEIAAGRLRSHAYDNAKVGASGRLPILIFSPGGGTTSIAYTTQMEEISSHGYIVVGVEHTFDAPAVLFPDGRVVGATGAYWTSLREQLPAPDNGEFEKKASEIFAADVISAIDKVIGLSRDRASAFYSRLDTGRIGVFGHSRGGRDAALACQLDSRIKACLSEDGNNYWQPFWLDGNGRSMTQPFMMLDHFDLDLPDEVYPQIGTTREAYTQNRSARRREADEKMYGTIQEGSYHVTVATPGISHNSFSDIRLLGRADSSQMNSWPKDVQAATTHSSILHTITEYALAFFDRHVRGNSAPLLNRTNSPPADVRIQRFGKAK